MMEALLEELDMVSTREQLINHMCVAIARRYIDKDPCGFPFDYDMSWCEYPLLQSRLQKHMREYHPTEKVNQKHLMTYLDFCIGRSPTLFDG
jgi:hypothetical protein